MTKRICVIAALSMLGFAGAFVHADDVSDIRLAGKGFTEALQDGDLAKARKYAFTDANSDKALDVMTDMTKSRKTLIDAAVAKFGDEGKNVVVGGLGTARTNSVNSDFDTAKIDVKGDTATVSSNDGADKRPAYFKKAGGNWKIDLTKLADFTKITSNAAIMHSVAASFVVSAGEISNGKYKTVQEAKTAVMQNMVAAARKNAPANRGG